MRFVFLDTSPSMSRDELELLLKQLALEYDKIFSMGSLWEKKEYYSLRNSLEDSQAIDIIDLKHPVVGTPAWSMTYEHVKGRLNEIGGYLIPYVYSKVISEFVNVPVTPVFTVKPSKELLLDNPGIFREDNTIVLVTPIALQKIIVPSIVTPRENILELRKNEEFKRRKVLFDHWLMRISKETESQYEIFQELEYMLCEYEHFMKLSLKNINTSMVEYLITSTAGMIENIAKLKLSEAIKPILEIGKRAYRIAEVERTAPGREVGFVSYIKENLIV